MGSIVLVVILRRPQRPEPLALPEVRPQEYLGPLLASRPAACPRPGAQTHIAPEALPSRHPAPLSAELLEHPLEPLVFLP